MTICYTVWSAARQLPHRFVRPAVRHIGRLAHISKHAIWHHQILTVSVVCVASPAAWFAMMPSPAKPLPAATSVVPVPAIAALPPADDGNTFTPTVPTFAPPFNFVPYVIPPADITSYPNTSYPNTILPPVTKPLVPPSSPVIPTSPSPPSSPVPEPKYSIGFFILGLLVLGFLTSKRRRKARGLARP